MKNNKKNTGCLHTQILKQELRILRRHYGLNNLDFAVRKTLKWVKTKIKIQ